MICKKCGANVKSDFKFCPYCGERIISDFHGQYEELDPPFVVQGPEQTGVTAEFYVEAPEEEVPDFQPPERSRRVDPFHVRFDADELRRDFESDLPEALQEEDEFSAPARFGGERREGASSSNADADEEEDFPPPRRSDSARGRGGFQPSSRFGEDEDFDGYLPPAPFEDEEEVLEGPARRSGNPPIEKAHAEAPYIVFRPDEPLSSFRASESTQPRQSPIDRGAWESAPVRGVSAKKEASPPRESRGGPGLGVKLLLIVVVLLVASALSIFGYRLFSQKPPFTNADNSASLASAEDDGQASII